MRQKYNSDVRYLFKKLEQYENNGELADMGHETIGRRFLCDVKETILDTSDLMTGSRQSTTSEFIITMEQLNFADGDLISTESKRTPENESMISNCKGVSISKRGNRHRKNPIKRWTFLAG